MRKILFRAKIKDEKRAKELNLKDGDWVYGYYFNDKGLEFINGISKQFDKHYIINTPCFEEFIEINPKTLGQYTGIKTKDSIQIFEGDIVLYRDWKQCDGGTECFINKGIVEYNEGNCCFNLTERVLIDIEDALYEGNEDLEVIGNIYDNPELLNMEKELEVGDFIRVQGIIGKIEQIRNSIFWLEDGSSYSLDNKAIKHSKNIIDLIEERRLC